MDANRDAFGDEAFGGTGRDLSGLPFREQAYLRAVFAGEALPLFNSDIIA